MGCPSEEELLDFVEGRMVAVPPRLEAHLDRCSACRDVVVAAASVEAGGRAHEAVGERYEVRGEVGRGGQSRVLRVYDRDLGREIALKQFLSRGDPGASQGPSPADRCLREVRVTGALSHPAILPIHDMGIRQSGAPYYTMPLVQGPTLSEVVAKTETVAARLRLLPHVVQVCQAIGYAHGQGFVHRDLKPDNIMVGAFGQTLLLDWGLARLPDAGEADPTGSQDGEPGVTLDGSVVGTPAYMSPEQAAADVAEVGPLSDVWSLGAVLHFVLCGRAPFGGDSVADTLKSVRLGKCGPIAAMDGDVPPELAAIVRRAMAAAPEDRYPSATALADDLIAFQSDARVSSYDYDLRERVLRFAQKYRALIVVAATIVVALAAVAVVLGIAYRAQTRAQAQTAHALRRAENSSLNALTQAEHSRQQVIAAAYALAEAHIDTAERERAALRPLTARLFAASALRNNPSFVGSPIHEGAPADRLELGEQITARALGQLAIAEFDPVRGIADVADRPPSVAKDMVPWVIEGPFLAVADIAGGVRVLGRTHKREIATLGGHDGKIANLDLSPTGRYLVTQDESGTLRRWRLPGGVLEGQWPGGSTFPILTISDDGAVGYQTVDGTVALRSDRRRSEARLPETDGAAVIAFSQGGTDVAIGTGTGRLVVASVASGRQLARIETGAPGIVSAVFSRDNSTIYAGGGRQVIIVDLEPAPRVETVSLSELPTALLLSPDERYVYAAASRAVYVVDVQARSLIAELPARIGMIHNLELAGRRLTAWSIDDSCVWELRHVESDIPTGRADFRRGDLDQPVLYGRVRGEPVLHVVDWDEAEASTVRLPGSAQVLQIGVTGSRPVTLRVDGSVTIWNATQRGWRPAKTRSFDDPEPAGLAAAGAHIAVARRDGSIVLWRPDHEGPDRILQGHHATPVIFLAFSDDGQHLVSGTLLGELFAWDLRQASPAPQKLALHAGNLRDVDFGNSNDEVIAAGVFGAKLWSREGSPTRVLALGSQRVAHAADGLVALVSADEWSLQVRDPQTDALVFAVRTSGAKKIRVAAIEPGGAALRIVGRDGAFRLPMRDHIHADAQQLLIDAERAAGHTTEASSMKAAGAR